MAASSSNTSQPTHYKRYLFGAVSGLIEVTSTHWIDVLKTRLQAEKETTVGINVRSLSSRIWAQEGFKGFYRGYISRMAGIGPMRAMFWGTMEVMNHELADHPEMGKGTKLVVAGLVGGFVQSICDVPIEVVKTKLMTSSDVPFKTLMGEAMKFRGAGATFSRNMMFAAIMNWGINYERPRDTSITETMLRAGLSGVIAATLTQPLDYVKTQQQKVGGFHDVNFIRLLITTGKRSLPLLWTGLISRATLSLATMSVSGTVFRLLGSLNL